jgi:hypothetical protein
MHRLKTLPRSACHIRDSTQLISLVADWPTAFQAYTSNIRSNDERDDSHVSPLLPLQVTLALESINQVHTPSPTLQSSRHTNILLEPILQKQIDHTIMAFVSREL